MPRPDEIVPRSDEIVRALLAQHATVATAESLTGGAVCAALIEAPGASAVVRGGIVAYTPAMKAALLGVDPDLIATAGIVSAEVAAAMARGARDATGASFAVATTGAAGPEPHDGAPPGRVWIAVEAPRGVRTLRLDIDGDRAAVRTASVARALDLLEAAIRGSVTQP